MNSATQPGLPRSLCPPLTDAGHGTVVMTSHWAAGGRTIDHITIEQADPHILVTDELLNEVAWSDHPLACAPPFATLKARDGYPTGCAMWHPTQHCWVGWFLTIEARNRTVVYRITSYDTQRNAWRASWPD